MWELTKYFEFEASHFLRNYVGDCANIHGHSYKVEVTFKGDKLDDRQILIDFKDIKKIVKTNVLERCDHKHLNDLPEYKEVNPTAETMAQLFFSFIAGSIDSNANYKLDSVAVWETSTSKCVYRED